MGITNTQYDAIMREYEKKRTIAQHRLDEKYDRVYKAIPEYADIEKQIREAAYKGGMESIGGDRAALSKMREVIETLSEKKEKLLVDNGYPKDYLSLEYTCPDCKDTGYIQGQKCHCLKQEILKLLYSKSNVSEILSRQNFDTLTMDLYSEEECRIMEPVIKACMEYVENFDKKPGNIMFCANPGVGKTFLTNCIAKALLDTAHSVIYFTSVQLFDRLSKYTFSYDIRDDDEGMKEDFYSCDLLIIDDLGTENMTKFVESQLFDIINERLIRSKATIVSTNLKIRDINERYSERVLSRLVGSYTVLRPEISDMRFKAKKIEGQEE